uniref:Serine/threonine dehydratase n=2 Tax=Aquisalinus luteolus TaxID=1566827 RepID=A0A8J3EUN7_9PROT|nr:serine/threonine dehydratase [Aquisalinus luteolus]
MGHVAGMVTINDIEQAADRIAPHVLKTPLLESETLNARLGGRLFVKAESLQKTGSFKLRGATNRISALSEVEKARGVVAYSSGNHAQGVALAAKIHHVNAVIVMPSDAPKVKIANTERHGAEVVLYDRDTESREEIGEAIAEKRGSVLIPPYDDAHIIAGQGTAGLEIAEQAEEAGVILDDVVICCSGGGLSSGVSLALADRSPETAVWTAEPEGFDDTARSLAAGRRVSNKPGVKSICDALLLPTPGSLTFPILSEHIAGGLVVDDDDVRRAMRIAFEEFKLVLEPGGAVALATILSRRIDVLGKNVAVIATGGNVDAALFAEVIQGR